MTEVKKITSTVVLSVVLVMLIVMAVTPNSASAATLTVTKIADTNDGTCDADCSLREAITAANAAGGTDTINFAIPGTGVHTIQPTSSLPDISSPVIIDGYSQSGSNPNTAVSPNPLNGTITIQLDGQLSGGASNGITFVSGSDGSQVKGLVINRFALDGIDIADAGSISVTGNYIGTDTNGMTDLGNGGRGVGSVTNVVSNNNLVGGTSPAERNVISGQSGGAGNEGIAICNVCNDWIVQGNYIGVGSDGQTAIPNQDAGISSNTGSAGMLIGGTASGATNVIAANDDAVNGSQASLYSDGALINNIIGTDYTKTLNLGTAAFGVGAQGNNNSIQGNTIRFSKLAGLFLAASSNTLIGGTTAAQANTITNNGGGVMVGSIGGAGGLNNSIIGNSIYDNAGGAISGLDIDLLGNTNDFLSFSSLGVTPNDTGDPDVTSNVLMNFPVINSISSSNGQVTINYNLDINNSETGALGYRIEFFANDSPNPSGHGGGQTLLGVDNIDGDVTNRSLTLTLPAGVSGAKYISATTTMKDASTDGFGHTSEFGSNALATLHAASLDNNLADTGQNLQIIQLVGLVVVSGGLAINMRLVRKGRTGISGR